MPGFEAGACEPITGGHAREGRGRVGCGGTTKENLKDVQGKTISLRFVVKNADLFSFRVADEKTETLPVPRATDR